MNVQKRNGTIVPFDGEKIENAITLAYLDTYGASTQPLPDYIHHIAHLIEIKAMERDRNYSVEEIQDEVERQLMIYDTFVARNYIRYRYKREAARKYKNDFLHSLSDKIEAKHVQNSNANVDEHSFGGRMGEVDAEVMRQYALEYCMSSKAKENHLNNRVYIHDLSHYALGDPNCLTCPIDDLLANGFKTRQTDIRPANSVNSAMQLTAVIFQLQSLCQFGGISAGHFDWSMVPYVRKSFYKHYCDGVKYISQKDYFWIPGSIGDEKIEENQWKNMADFMCKWFKIDDRYGYSDENAYKYAMDMTEREIHQAVEALIHNLNSLQSRSGCQLPFTSIDLGTCTLPEGRMVIKAMLDGFIEGTGPLHRTPIFPCLIMQLQKGVNRAPGDPNYDLFRLALKSTALRLYPNYANVDWSVNASADQTDPKQIMGTMGCRTYNGFDINGLGQQKDGRGNGAPVTIILPTLAMEAKEWFDLHGYTNYSNEEVFNKFIDILDATIHEAKDSLIERYEYMCHQDEASAPFTYDNHLYAGYIPGEGIRSALKHFTWVIGQLGLAETLQIIFGKDHTDPEIMIYAQEIEKLFNTRCKEFKEQYSLNFGVYYSPAESLCYTAMKKFKQKYGVIPKVSDHDYFTNSMHVPVWDKVGVLEKIDIESKLTGFSNAGCITYVELDTDVRKNIDALEEIVNYAMDKDIPYFAINVPNDVCVDCGYNGNVPEGEACPKCGSHNIERLRRVTGYLSTTYEHFNQGKIAEVKDRIKHANRMEI